MEESKKTDKSEEEVCDSKSFTIKLKEESTLKEEFGMSEEKLKEAIIDSIELFTNIIGIETHIKPVDRELAKQNLEPLVEVLRRESKRRKLIRERKQD